MSGTSATYFVRCNKKKTLRVGRIISMDTGCAIYMEHEQSARTLDVLWMSTGTLEKKRFNAMNTHIAIRPVCTTIYPRLTHALECS